MIKQQLATISILVKNRQINSESLNKLLSLNGHIIMNRLGVNVEPMCVSNCFGLIILVVKSNLGQIKKFETELKKIKGLTIKISIMGK
ncbi:MAG TPA: hypothetical protein PKL13_01975 [bacterium]|nr:hypothetical protein [bacterium]